jgi:hypothetical protein
MTTGRKGKSEALPPPPKFLEKSEHLRKEGNKPNINKK